jgi:outer membrane phospholipase A
MKDHKAHCFNMVRFLSLIVLLQVFALTPLLCSGVAEAVENRAGQRYDSIDSLFTLYQPYLTNIGSYKPVYFLVGADPEDSRFQLSFKYQLFGDESPLARKHPWVTNIHLGYTQTSSWDLKSDSAPFEDTSYMPEVFFLTHNMVGGGGRIDGLFFQAGVQHESNGQGGDASRSTNYVYLCPVGVFYKEELKAGFAIAPKLVGFFNNSDNTNPDIDDYRGNFELEMKVGVAESVVLGSRFRFAPEGSSIQLDMTYPLSMAFFSNLEVYLHLQYVDTLAETLKNYEERTEAFRIGFSIVR